MLQVEQLLFFRYQCLIIKLFEYDMMKLHGDPTIEIKMQIDRDKY